MEARLKQAHAGRLLPDRTIQSILHQASSDATVLSYRIDRDRPEAGNARTFV